MLFMWTSDREKDFSLIWHYPFLLPIHLLCTDSRGRGFLNSKGRKPEAGLKQVTQDKGSPSIPPG